MFTLVTDKSKYYRVKDGQSGAEVEAALKMPVGDAFAGRIIERGEPMQIYVAKPLDTYRTVAEKFGVSEEELALVNGQRPVYPTCKLFVPYKKNRVSI